MPAKPAWYRNLSNIIRGLQAHPYPYVDRATIEFLLGVGRRRAQQIIAPCVTDRVGTNGLADRDALVHRLQLLAAGDDTFYEIRRRRKVAALITALRQERLRKPQLLVEAQDAVLQQEFDNLPPGVRLEPGHITVEFEQPQQALEKLLALAMAISNDFERFERITAHA